MFFVLDLALVLFLRFNNHRCGFDLAARRRKGFRAFMALAFLVIETHIGRDQIGIAEHENLHAVTGLEAGKHLALIVEQVERDFPDR